MARHLVVVVPGIAGGLATWSSLLARLKREPGLAGATWVEWHHRLHAFSLRRLAHTAR